MPIFRIACALVCVTFALTASDADAKKKKKKKKADVQKMSKAGPQLKYDQFRRKVEVQVAEKREAQIEGLQRLLDLGPEEAEIPDIKFRLAELFFEKSQFYFFRAQEADDKMIAAQAKGNPAAAESHEAEKRKHAVESQNWAKKAVQLYAQIREAFPNYKRMPEVLFALGQSHWNAGRLDAAIEVYTDLIKNFKDSPLVLDAWLAFGEYYFNKADLNRALKAYTLAAGDKRHPVYGFAVYKQGWCYYNLADWKKAGSKFRAVIFYSEFIKDSEGRKITLAKEARKDFVRTFAHFGTPSRAKFEIGELIEGDENCKGDLCHKLLENLADIWFGQGDFDEASTVYKDLMRLHPKSSRNPYFQGKIVDIVSRGRNMKRTVFETRRLVDEYRRVEKQVKDGTGDKNAKANLAEAEVLAETTLRRLAQVWNKEAKKTRQKKTFGYARTMYEDYLKLFPKTKFGYEMRFQLGDLYYKLEEFDKAAQAYKDTVIANPKGKYLIDAANDNILAVEEHLKDLRLKKPKLKGNDPSQIHPQRMRLIQACDRYAKHVPPDKAKKLISVKYKAAKIYYDHNQFDESIKRFNELVGTDPSADEASYAANLIVDIYNLRAETYTDGKKHDEAAEQWKLLYDTSVTFLKNDKLLEERPKLRSDLGQFAQFAKFKLVQILEDKLKSEGRSLKPVAKAYEEFQREFPASENADKALFNASVAWDLVGEKEHADKLRALLMTEYKDSELRKDVNYYIAKSHEERAEYRKAADLFKQFANKYPGDDRAGDALYNASVFYAGVGKVKLATTLREEYLKKYGTKRGKEREAADIYFSIADDLERNKRWKLAAQRYEEFVKKFRRDERVFEALWRQVQIRRKYLRQRSKSEKLEKTILGEYKLRKKKPKRGTIPPEAADYASRIDLKFTHPVMRPYLKMRIRRPDLRRVKRFKGDIKQLARARDKVIKAYTRIVTEYQQAHSTIGALERIAFVWERFRDSLIGVRCPRQLTGEQCDLFKQQMEAEIDPARQASLEAYRTCAAKSSELSVFTKDSAKCMKKLMELVPEEFPQISEKSMPYQPPPTKLSVETQPLILKPAGSYEKEPEKTEQAGKAEKPKSGKKKKGAS